MSISKSTKDRKSKSKSAIGDLFAFLRANKILIKNSDEIEEYLSDKPDMISLVKSICCSLLERFQKINTPTQFSLEMYHDPEIDDSHPILYIRQSKYEDDVLDIADGVCAKYEKNLSSVKGWLLITTDFRPIE